jgi:hypothetical protein
MFLFVHAKSKYKGQTLNPHFILHHQSADGGQGQLCLWLSDIGAASKYYLLKMHNSTQNYQLYYDT